MGIKLKSLKLEGYKSFQQLPEFQPGPINIFIGANGAGKSNFISFFRFLSMMMSGDGELQLYVGLNQGAGRFLYDGPSTTQNIEAEMTLESDNGFNEYRFRLSYAAGDTFTFADEEYRSSPRDSLERAPWNSLGAGQREAKLNRATSGEAGKLRDFLHRLAVHHFHDTSQTARIRGKWPVSDARELKQDGGNLAARLLHLKCNHASTFARVEDYVRLVAPFFSEFVLEPESDAILLQWREAGSDVIFNVGQAADGFLRAVALITLLTQPDDHSPYVMFLDEPELGLHPYAIEVVAALMRRASLRSQLFVATQSAQLVAHFQPEDIVVVHRRRRESSLERQNGEELASWLEDYSLGDLMLKNVMGGGPGF